MTHALGRFTASLVNCEADRCARKRVQTAGEFRAQSARGSRENARRGSVCVCNQERRQKPDRLRRPRAKGEPATNHNPSHSQPCALQVKRGKGARRDKRHARP